MRMYVTAQLYKLAFSPPLEGLDPCIVFTLERQNFDELSRRLATLMNQYHAHARSYCQSEVIFALPNADALHGEVFGYGECGYLSLKHHELSLCIRLRWGLSLAHAALTINLLAHALCVPIENEHPWSLLQQVDFRTCCDHTVDGYGHAVGGNVSWRLLNWIRGRANGQRIRAPKEVLEAMRQAWTAVTLPEDWRWANYCDGRFSPDGGFMLECLGNACDIAIYPDGTCGDEDDSFRPFTCHNLDTREQQLTLLAGLAKMCELARKEE